MLSLSNVTWLGLFRLATLRLSSSWSSRQAASDEQHCQNGQQRKSQVPFGRTWSQSYSDSRLLLCGNFPVPTRASLPNSSQRHFLSFFAPSSIAHVFLSSSPVVTDRNDSLFTFRCVIQVISVHVRVCPTFFMRKNRFLFSPTLTFTLINHGWQSLHISVSFSPFFIWTPRLATSGQLNHDIRLFYSI